MALIELVPAPRMPWKFCCRGERKEVESINLIQESFESKELWHLFNNAGECFYNFDQRFDVFQEQTSQPPENLVGFCSPSHYHLRPLLVRRGKLLTINMNLVTRRADGKLERSHPYSFEEHLFALHTRPTSCTRRWPSIFSREVDVLEYSKFMSSKYCNRSRVNLPSIPG